MGDRKGTRGIALVVVLYAGIVLAAPFLAERSARLYGFVALVLIAGALLAAVSRSRALTWQSVILVALLLRAGAFWLPPGLSDDAYRYAFDGQLQVEGFNPYSRLPSDSDLSDLQTSPVFERLNSEEFYSVYPPLSQIAFAAASILTGSKWPATYYVVKLIIILVELMALFALSRITTASRGILYAWNPVVVMEVAGQAHTEGLAAGLLLAGLLLARKDRTAMPGAAIAGAGMVKLYPFLFLPPLIRRNGWRSAAAGAATTLILALPYAAPGVAGNIRQSLELYVTFFEFNAGPYFAAKELLRLLTGQDLGKIIGPAFRWIFLFSLPAVYYMDWRFQWTLERVVAVLMGLLFILSTTVHPWYLVPFMGVLVLEERFRWHWYWLMIVSAGTYLLYVDGPYWAFVTAGWVGWALLAILFHFDTGLQFVQRVRARLKWRGIRDWIIARGKDSRILDLGCGEGYVGLEAERAGASVVLADIIDFNRTPLPFRKVDETDLPFEKNAFDYTLLYFVLHHCSDPKAVIKEAARVSRSGVLVVESVYRGAAQLSVLSFMDRFANRVRSGGKMSSQEPHLAFKRTEEWRRLFDDQGLIVHSERTSGHWLHQKAFFLVTK